MTSGAVALQTANGRAHFRTPSKYWAPVLTGSSKGHPTPPHMAIRVETNRMAPKGPRIIHSTRFSVATSASHSATCLSRAACNSATVLDYRDGPFILQQNPQRFRSKVFPSSSERCDGRMFWTVCKKARFRADFRNECTRHERTDGSAAIIIVIRILQGQLPCKGTQFIRGPQLIVYGTKGSVQIHNEAQQSPLFEWRTTCLTVLVHLRPL